MVTQRRLGIHASVTATTKNMGRFSISAVAAVFLTVLLLRACRCAAQEHDFRSINCGGEKFLDSKTQITWEADPFNNDTTGYYGSIGDVSSEYKNTTSAIMSTLRYFPNDERNEKFCYSLEVSNGSTYLLRTTFLYGNYDGLDQAPVFSLIINYDFWINVNFTSSAIPTMRELTFISTQENLDICLVPSRSTSHTPFISSIELRRLEVDMYTEAISQSSSALSKGYGLLLWKRINYGARNEEVIRYPDDPYDRIWEANTSGPTLRLSPNKVGTYYGADPEKPPAAVMATAITSSDPKSNLTLTYEGYGGSKGFRVYMHFQELDETAREQPPREFNINFPNSSPALDQLVNLLNIVAVSLEAPNIAVIDEEVPPPLPFQITFLPVDSTRGPMLNAIELFQPTSQLGFGISTYPDDVVAIKAIQKLFNIVGYGQGDPCMPLGYEWTWIDCSEGTQPRIIKITLTNLNLAGEIPPIINQLTSLRSIDLSHNMLNGSIPDLSMLQNLSYLDVSNNTLCGKLPSFYFQTLIKFKYDGNERLCDQPKCNCTSSKYISNSNSTQKYTIAIFFTSGLCVVLLLMLILYKAKHIRTKRKKAALAIEANQKAVDGDNYLSYGTKVFTYNEISNATLNFTTILGEGGFGKVYRGLLPTGEAIAVKLLAEASKQGLKEFYNEVAILSRVCHKNLVSLLGYCVENTYMLIYEYIEKGNLRDLIYGDVESEDRPLSWRTRLHIALDASQGLEYLHTGCDPIVIHRDVKSSNILLGEKMQAKVADFGVSRLKEGDTAISHVSTVNVVGTFGYLDPEYNATNQLTDKSDVYSFGIVLLELVCGRPPIDRFSTPSHIVEWVFVAMAKQGDDEHFVNLEDLPPFISPFPILQPDDLDHNEAQWILKEEDERIKNTGVEAFIIERNPREGLEGPALSLEQCNALVPDAFVQNHLLCQPDTTQNKNPRQRYQCALSLLQHVDLSKVILERLFRKTNVFLSIIKSQCILCNTFFVKNFYTNRLIGKNRDHLEVWAWDAQWIEREQGPVGEP